MNGTAGIRRFTLALNASFKEMDEVQVAAQAHDLLHFFRLGIVGKDARLVDDNARDAPSGALGRGLDTEQRQDRYQKELILHCVVSAQLSSAVHESKSV